MRGLSPLRGTWLGVLVALVPVLWVTVASASPWEPVTTSTVPALPASSVDGDVLTVSHVIEVPDSDGADAPEDVPGVGAGQSDDGVNHGRIVSQAHDLTDGVEGCVNRQIAQSDLGKKNADGGDDGPALLDDGTVDPSSLDLDCTNGKPGTADDGETPASRENGNSGNSQGNSETAQDSKPSKPAQTAPGKDKTDE